MTVPPLVVETARRLGPINDRVVYVGGAIIPLLLTLPVVRFRPTDDVDVIVEVTSRPDFGRLEAEMRQRGFEPDVESGIICRWKAGGLTVDLMPTDETILGFSNRWYDLAIASATPVNLPDAPPIRLIAAPVFLATKFDAFASRGDVDYLGSHDLEDVVTVLDARPEIVAEVKAVEPELRNHLVEQARFLLSQPGFVQAIPGHVEQGPIAEERAAIVKERLREISLLGDL